MMQQDFMIPVARQDQHQIQEEKRKAVAKGRDDLIFGTKAQLNAPKKEKSKGTH